jgi:hypothetical protein|tara:strand:+ start:43 stop:291 length:249 start_codon:yes stop_codon:yes gene_type:complete
MAFIEQKESIRYEIINGKQVPIYTPRVEITLKNLKTGQEYNSDAEALTDVQNVNTDTKAEHVSRSVHMKMIGIPLGSKTNII